MNTIQSLIGGATGAVALTAIHQTAAKTLPHAPRVDVIGRRVVAGSARAIGMSPPVGQTRQNAALALDLVSNALFYSLLGLSKPKNLWRNATALGLLAGAGALALPPVMGMGSKPVARTLPTALYTVAWYTLGSLATASVLAALEPQKSRQTCFSNRR
jgi:hypothetical protein